MGGCYLSVTLKDIAKETGLSVATVSKYVNGVALKEKNRIAVECAIKKLGYTANEYARSLKSNKSRTIGVVIPELSNLFIATILTHMEDILRSRGYSVIICDCHSQEELECEAVDFLLRKMVDGIINVPVCRDGRHLLPAVAKNIPVVLVDRAIPELQLYANSVLIDNESAAYHATKYLLERSHRQVGIIIGPGNVYTSLCRLAGYQAALREYQIDCDEALIAYSDYSVQGGYTSLCALLDKNPAMTAIFVTNYEMTLGAIIAANERSIKIPDELSFIGFDNLDLSRVTHPKLTIVSQPLQAIGTQVAKIILEQLSDPGSGIPISVSLPTRIQEGNSVSQLDA